MTVQIEGRFLLVGYPDQPKEAWARVLYYQYADGGYRPAEPVTLAVSSSELICELLVFDPLTGEQWRLPVPWPRGPA